ncbi:MAG: CRISPR-associated endoribonuclease Cas6, partial [Cyanobacteria bacterium J06576_12]
FCGTGHKTTFGLGETHLGWQESATVPAVPTGQLLLAERIDELTALFMSMKKRQGGKRAQDTAQKWATILARREQGDGLEAIAHDMHLTYETTKTYSKLARRALREINDKK